MHRCRQRVLLSQNLHALDLSIRLARVDLLPRLSNRLQHCLVGEVRLGDHGGGLRVEGDVVGFHTCLRQLAQNTA